MDKEFDNGLDVFASYTNTEAESGMDSNIISTFLKLREYG